LAALAVVAACTAVPPAADADVEVAREPGHRLALSNASANVYVVAVPPGGATLFHRHRHDNVAVMLSDATITNTLKGKPTSQPLSVATGVMSFARAEGEGYVHQVAVVGATVFRNVTIELLRPAGSAPALSPLPQGLKAAVDNERVRATVLALAPGETSPALRLGAGVRVVLEGTGVQEFASGGAARPIAGAAGEPVWREAGEYRLKNTASTTVRVAEFELR
jgi:hypothetical protein